MTGRGLSLGMGRAERRAKIREETERERSSKAAPAAPSVETSPRSPGESLVADEETARRVSRTGGKADRVAKTGHGLREKRLKWREGRQ
jgi:hypothetical protein